MLIAVPGPSLFPGRRRPGIEARSDTLQVLELPPWDMMHTIRLVWRRRWGLRTAHVPTLHTTLSAHVAASFHLRSSHCVGMTGISLDEYG